MEAEERPKATFEQSTVKVYQDSKGGLILRLRARFSASWLNTPVHFAWLKTDMSSIFQKDNGMGGEGDCPFHKHQHVQMYLPGEQPMKCHEAMKMMEMKEKNGHW